MSKFIKGMDLSTLLELERCGAKYYEDGTTQNRRMVSLTVRVTMIWLRLLLSEKRLQMQALECF